MLKGMSVFLIGMMGVGKTTVGKNLAKQLGYRFCDTDVLIETVANQTISNIFAGAGEASFRELESQVLSEVSAYTKTVIATGGGIVLKQMNWSYLRHGLIVWLDADVDLLLERLKEDSTRPLLQEVDPEAKLKSLLEERTHLYSQADLHICLKAEQTPEAIAQQIVSEIPTVLKEEKHL